MRELNVKEITAAVAKLCCDACYYLPQDLLEKFKASRDTEESPLGREVLETIIENAELAARKDVPLCQDTGLAVVFLEIGQEVHFTGGALEEAVNAGVAEGYTKRAICANLPLMTRCLNAKTRRIIRLPLFIPALCRAIK